MSTEQSGEEVTRANPRDTADLAREAAIRGGISESTLVDAYKRVQRQKQQAQDDDKREQWDDAEQALLGAIAATRRRNT